MSPSPPDIGFMAPSFLPAQNISIRMKKVFLGEQIGMAVNGLLAFYPAQLARLGNQASHCPSGIISAPRPGENPRKIAHFAPG